MAKEDLNIISQQKAPSNMLRTHSQELTRKSFTKNSSCKIKRMVVLSNNKIVLLIKLDKLLSS